MAAIFQIRRGDTNIAIADGELYLHKGSGSIQFGSGSTPYNLLALNTPSYGDINLIGNISASGDVRIGGNIYLGNATADNISALGQFTTNLVPNGTIDVGTISSPWTNVYATNISASNIIGNIGGLNIAAFSTSVDARLDFLEIASESLQSFTSSQLTQNLNLATYTTSVESRFSTLATYTGSINTKLTEIGIVSGSLISTASNHEQRIGSIESYTSSLKTAIGVSGEDVTINGKLTVLGTTTQIDSTQVNIGENILELNYGGSATEAGIYTKDATGGSTISGSLLWDATNDYWKAGTKDNESKILLAGGDNVFTSSAQLTDLNSFTQSADSRLSNLELKSASVDTSISNINLTTSSLNISVSELNLTTASLNTSVLNINTFTSSANSRLNNLESTSASVNISIDNLNIYTQSVNLDLGLIHEATASLNQFTQSANGKISDLIISSSDHEGRLDYLEGVAFGGIDLNAQFAALEIVTSSLQSFTASVAGTNEFTASTKIRLDNLELTSASINSWSSSLNATFATDAEVAAGYEAKGSGIVSSSAQIVPLLPTGVISGSSQVTNIANNQLVNSSVTIAGTSVSLGGSITAAKILEATNVISSSAQISTLLPSGVVSGSSQIDLTATTNYESGILARLNAVGVVSGSSQINLGSATGNITLATQTTGDYVASLVQGTGVTITNNSGENSTPTIAIGQAVGTSANVQFNSIGVGTTASGTAGEIRATGDITAYYSSDIRLKENIIPIPNALEKINQISGNTYDWKEGYDEIHSHKGNDVGVIAQEIEAVLPQIVTNRDTGFKAVQYEKIIPLLIEAIKELSAKVDSLENK